MALMRQVYPNLAVLRSCPECMMDDVPGTASRCKYCCSSLTPLPTKKSAFDEIITKVSNKVTGGDKAEASKSEDV